MGRVSNRAVSSLFYAVVGALFILSIGHVNAATKMGGTYVGSETCATCHRPQHNEWDLSGHSKMLLKSEDARKMGLPLPEGWAWDDISYVIGGRNWKLRFVDKKGYIVTMTGPKKDKPGKTNSTWKTVHGTIITQAKGKNSLAVPDAIRRAIQRKATKMGFPALLGLGPSRSSAANPATGQEVITSPKAAKKS